MWEPRQLRVFKFILKNPQFSLKDKLEYFVYLFLALAGIFLIGYSLWNSLSINYLGFILLIILIFYGPKKYRKFIVPFNQQLLGEEVAQKEKLEFEYSSSLAQQTLTAFLKTDIYFWLLNLFFFILIIASVIILFALKFSFVWVLSIAILEFLIWIMVSIKVWRKTWKQVGELQQTGPQQFRVSVLLQIVIGSIVLILVFLFISFRYKAITGRNFWEGFIHSGITINSLPSEKYVLIQIVSSDEDSLLEKNTVEDSSFILDKTNRTLQLKFPRETKAGYPFFDDLDDITILMIENDETGRKYGTDKYSIIPKTKLPLYLVTAGVEFKTRILEIGKNGELTVERETYEPKVAKWEMKNTSKSLSQIGKIYETVKILPNNTFEFTDNSGGLLRLIHLGVFPKSGIIYSPNF